MTSKRSLKRSHRPFEVADSPPVTLPFRVLELGDTLATAICGRMFAELGADVVAIRRHNPDPEDLAHFAVDIDKRHVAVATRREFQAVLKRLAAGADLIVVGGSLKNLESSAIHPDTLRTLSPDAVVAAITPYGLTGPRKDDRSTDLIAFYSSGIALRMAGRVADPEADPPVRASGEQSEFISGVTAACAAMFALYERERSHAGQLIDVSIEEALACQAMDELARPAAGKHPSDRIAPLKGGGVVITILEAADGWLAVSPRENHQWKAWAAVIGRPEFAIGTDYDTREARVEHWDEIYDFMSEWSATRDVKEIVEMCREAHVPCFPFGGPGAMLALPQLEHRRFFRSADHPVNGAMKVPGPPHAMARQAKHVPSADVPAASAAWRETSSRSKRAPKQPGLPLDGVRVLDFSWVIAGPTCTHYLAAMGAEVIKVENPERPDPGRGSELHAVLGQLKLGVSLDLKDRRGLDAALRLVEQSDVVVENFATGVMNRLGLSYEALRQRREGIILLSTSGLGRTGPDALRPAYGNLLSAFTGFSELNGYPGRSPATGMAWADPLCGLMMAFSVTAALNERRRTGSGRHIDFSMIEALLWGMPAALVEAQIGNGTLKGMGNGHKSFAPHGVYRCSDEDDWLAIAVTSDSEWHHLVAAVPGLTAFQTLSEDERRRSLPEIERLISEWASGRTGAEAARALQPNVPASASRSSLDLFNDDHLSSRGFYQRAGGDPSEPKYPGLPWRTDSLIQPSTPAASLGQHTEQVLREIAGLTNIELELLAASGALA